MKIAIVGGDGLIARHLRRHWTEREHGAHDVRALSHAELDVSDRAAVRGWCERERPQLLVDCAVLGVDRCESEPALAQAVNADGPRHLTEAAADVGAELLHFSTNYVFDGRAHGHVYTPRDPTLPINVYGSTKLAGERAVLAAHPRSYVVRTSWVFGSGKESFLASLPHRLRAGERVRAIADVWASATYVHDLVERVVELLARRHYGLHQVVNGGVCSYHEFALACARLLGMDEARSAERIERVALDHALLAADRPRYTPMLCASSPASDLPPLRSWTEALAEYVGAAAP